LLLGRQQVASFVPMSETRYRRDPLRAEPGTDCHDNQNQSMPKQPPGPPDSTKVNLWVRLVAGCSRRRRGVSHIPGWR